MTTIPSPGSGEVVVRPLRADDLNRLLKLMEAHASFERAHFDPDRKYERLAEALLGDQSRSNCIVAERRGVVIGYATFSREFSTWDADEYLHMDTLFVAAEHRGSGVGALLLQQVLDFAASSGLINTQCQTPDWNQDALRLYERVGAIAQPKIRLTLPTPLRSASPTRTRSINGQVLDSFGAAWEARDLDAIALCLHSECSYSPSVATELNGQFVGVDDVLAGISIMWQHDAGSNATFGDEIETGDRIVRTWTYHFDSGSKEYGIDVFSFTDGLLISKDAYRKGLQQSDRLGTPIRDVSDTG
ncbi:MAG: GNAT family N-acetyltransferase [Acidimicrobiales bacterium]